MKMEKTIAVILVIVLILSLCACAKKPAEKPLCETFTISENKEFRQVSLDVNSEQFQALGFVPGDVCDVQFSNGYKMENTPYSSGYYFFTGENVIVDYPGYEHIDICIDRVESTWDVIGCKEGDTVTITRTEQGKFAKENGLMKVSYTNKREDYGTDEEFANYRVLRGGKLLPDTFYRGASAVDNRNGRAQTVNKLLERDGIRFLFDFPDDEESFLTHCAENNSGYAEKLFGEGKVAALAVGSQYYSETYQKNLAKGFRKMMHAEGPYYIFCAEGKDRTGFACLLMEALAGATYEEIRDDYMKSYDCYYHISKQGTPEQYKAFEKVRLQPMICYLSGLPHGTDFSGMTFVDGAKSYLQTCGMTDEEISAFSNFLQGLK